MPDNTENQTENQLEIRTDLGRPPCLDETRRRKIIALLANGSSRRVAARVVGCSHSSIARTAQRDPEIAAELDAAEHSCEIEALQNGRHFPALLVGAEPNLPTSEKGRRRTTSPKADCLSELAKVGRTAFLAILSRPLDQSQIVAQVDPLARQGLKHRRQRLFLAARMQRGMKK